MIDTMDERFDSQRYLTKYQIEMNAITGISIIKASANENGNRFVILASINLKVVLM